MEENKTRHLREVRRIVLLTVILICIAAAIRNFSYQIDIFRVEEPSLVYFSYGDAGDPVYGAELLLTDEEAGKLVSMLKRYRFRLARGWKGMIAAGYEFRINPETTFCIDEEISEDPGIFEAEGSYVTVFYEGDVGGCRSVLAGSDTFRLADEIYRNHLNDL